MPESNVLVLYAGGTIGMAPPADNPNGPLKPQKKSELEKWLPRSLKKLEELGIKWEIQSLIDDKGNVVDPIDSSNVSSTHWKYMARAVGKNYDDYDGFVILHGTDTMAFTASALSFMFVNLGKPVIITGSQLPLPDPRTDAVSNLVNALMIAGYRASGLPRIPEVVLCFADVILRGNRSRKISSSSWRGFETPNYPALGRIGEHITIDTTLLRPSPSEEEHFFVREELNDDVIDVGLFPGMQARHMDAQFELDGLRGVVLRTFGAGNGPSTEEFLGPIARAVGRGLVIVNVTQCVEGKVEAGLYEASSGLLELGVLSGIDMTSEAALTKLMSLLEVAPQAIRVQMQVDQAGEMSESLFDLKYGEISSADGRAISSQTPPGKYQRRLLTNAMLRVGSMSTPGADNVDVRVFVNHPNANAETQKTDRRYACSIPGGSGAWGGDITATIRNVVEPGDDITLSLVPVRGGIPIEARGVSLALFTGSPRV